jgi:hypothetical protein
VIFVGKGTNPKIIDERRETDKTYHFYNNIIYNMSPDATYNWKDGSKRFFSNNLFYGYHPENEPDDAEKKIADPLFTNPGSGGMGIWSVAGYKLKRKSPCLNAGMDIPENGGRDYWGNKLTDGKPDRGAFELNKQ